ncbi:MAG TPA: hypothetical protein VN408_24060, partial [Actinoplanes sp.]|nr:hypothetical protein [Actinoplanes sp.]
SEREAGQACAAADVSSAHRRPLLLIRADPAATVSFDAGVLRAELGRALAGAPLTVTAGTPARIDIGPTASRTICAHTGQMIVGRLPHDIRPIHVLTEARERLVAALRLLAARMPDTGLEVHLEDAARLSADTASLRFLALRASAGAAAGAGEAFERLTDRVLTAEHALLDRLHATTGDLSDVEELPSLSA